MLCCGGNLGTGLSEAHGLDTDEERAYRTEGEMDLRSGGETESSVPQRE